MFAFILILDLLTVDLSPLLFYDVCFVKPQWKDYAVLCAFIGNKCIMQHIIFYVYGKSIHIFIISAVIILFVFKIVSIHAQSSSRLSKSKLQIIIHFKLYAVKV